MSTFINILDCFSPLPRRFTAPPNRSFFTVSVQQLGALAHKVKGRGKQFVVCCLFDLGFLYGFPLAPSGGAAGKPTQPGKLPVSVFG